MRGHSKNAPPTRFWKLSRRHLLELGTLCSASLIGLCFVLRSCNSFTPSGVLKPLYSNNVAGTEPVAQVDSPSPGPSSQAFLVCEYASTLSRGMSACLPPVS